MVRYAKNWLTPDEIAAMHRAARPGRDRLIVELLYGCALRCSEMLALRVEDMDIKQGAIILRSTKTTGGTPQMMAVPAQVLASLKAWACGKEPGELLIRLDHSTIYRLLQRLADKAGVKKKIGTHAPRRSRATNELDAGADLKVVQDLLRHKSITTTCVYLNYSTARVRKVQDGFKL